MSRLHPPDLGLLVAGSPSPWSQSLHRAGDGSLVSTRATKGERFSEGAIWSFFFFFSAADGSFLMDLRLASPL